MKNRKQTPPRAGWEIGAPGSHQGVSAKEAQKDALENNLWSPTEEKQIPPAAGWKISTTTGGRMEGHRGREKERGVEIF